eukprot:365091-Chlamydomonas_euryale.AAC.5
MAPLSELTPLCRSFQLGTGMPEAGPLPFILPRLTKLAEAEPLLVRQACEVMSGMTVWTLGG